MVDIDLHRTDIVATAAQAARMRQAVILLGIAAGGEDRANWPRHRRVIAVATAAPIDRASVHASATANTVQRASKFVARQSIATAVIEQHHMQLAAGRG